MAGFNNDTMYADNWDFRGNAAVVPQVTASGQLPIGTGGTPAIRVGTLISPLGSVTIGYTSPNITLEVTGFAFTYTDVTFAMSPYTVTDADEYISCNSTAGAITLRFPNAPSATRTWVIKDRTGTAATNNITITTVGGAVTIDGATTYVMNSNYQAINMLANATPTYEVY